MDFDINNLVRVKLTDKGRAVHAADHALFCASEGRKLPYTPPKEDSHGYSEWQMWQLMEAFGKYLGNGFDMPFDPVIELAPPTDHVVASNERRIGRFVMRRSVFDLVKKYMSAELKREVEDDQAARFLARSPGFLGRIAE